MRRRAELASDYISKFELLEVPLVISAHDRAVFLPAIIVERWPRTIEYHAGSHSAIQVDLHGQFVLEFRLREKTEFDTEVGTGDGLDILHSCGNRPIWGGFGIIFVF